MSSTRDEREREEESKRHTRLHTHTHANDRMMMMTFNAYLVYWMEADDVDTSQKMFSTSVPQPISSVHPALTLVFGQDNNKPKQQPKKMVIAGIIRPPPEIRAVADKTASFVAKNGRAFESRILNSEKGRTPKFAFLQDTSPFHAYYEDRIQFYQGGGEDNNNNNNNNGDSSQQEKQESKKDADAKLKAQQKELKQQQKQQQKASALDPIAKVLLDQRKKIREEYERQQKELQEEEEEKKKKIQDGQEQPFVPPPPTRVGVTPPPSLRFVNITAPHSLSTVQVETIKLVAQFTALDESKNFLQSLTIREWHNPLFAFLQPRHTHFAYFSALTDCYKDILYQSHNNNSEKTPSLWPESPQQCLEWAAYRSEYERHVLERQSNASNDFNNNDAAAGTSIDWHDFVVVETIDFAMDEIVAPPPLPEPTTTTTTAAAAAANQKDKDTEEAMDESDDDDDDEPAIRVVPNYTPKIVSATQTDRSRTHVIDPITGKSVPVSDTTEHMRIQLLDPKWAQEKKKFQDKQKESNLVSGDVIASNISRLAADTVSPNQHTNQHQKDTIDLSLSLSLLCVCRTMPRDPGKKPTVHSSQDQQCLLLRRRRHSRGLIQWGFRHQSGHAWICLPRELPHRVIHQRLDWPTPCPHRACPHRACHLHHQECHQRQWDSPPLTAWLLLHQKECLLFLLHLLPHHLCSRWRIPTNKCRPRTLWRRSIVRLSLWRLPFRTIRVKWRGTFTDSTCRSGWTCGPPLSPSRKNCGDISTRYPPTSCNSNTWHWAFSRTPRPLLSST